MARTDFKGLAAEILRSDAAHYPVTLGNMAEMAEVICQAFGQQIEELRATVSRQGEALAALQARPELAYHGTWKSGQVYDVGSLCTDHGSMWFCNKRTEARPGSHADWTLCCKRGSIK